MAKGRVIKATGSWYTVLGSADEEIQSRIKGKVRLLGDESTNPVTVGDWVEYEVDSDGIGAIESIYDRINLIKRKSVNLSRKTQIIAANIDQAIILATANYPMTSSVFIDRFLTAAHAYSIPCIIIVNKLDRYRDKDLDLLAEWADTYATINYRFEAISIRKKINLDFIQPLLENKTSLIAGNSGVGKSSLIKLVAPELSIKIGEISDANNAGKHTTTFSEMHKLPFGGYIIDTPGIRGFGTIGFEREEIYHFFPEIFAAASACKFHNCLHINEPDCAVKSAVEEGKISYSRYRSYVSILNDPEDTKYRV